MPRTNASMWNTLPIDMSSVSVPETVGGRPRCSTMSQTSSALLPCDEGHRLRLSHHTGVLLPNTRTSARYVYLLFIPVKYIINKIYVNELKVSLTYTEFE